MDDVLTIVVLGIAVLWLILDRVFLVRSYERRLDHWVEWKRRLDEKNHVE